MKNNIVRDVRTWIDIDSNALRHNAEQFLRLIPQETRLMAVVKSNAYGHGLVHVAKILSSIGPPASRFQIWFGVDSIVEGLCLRREKIQNPILVLGYTLPSRVKEAVEHDMAITVSSFEMLKVLQFLRAHPRFHLKLDTGLHRQGLLERDIPELIRILHHARLVPEGVFTHFASAKSPHDISYTESQIKQFCSMVSIVRQSGFPNLIRHASATGGTLLFPEAHFDMVRIGMGLYGYWPSEEIRTMNQESGIKNRRFKMTLKQILTWKTVVSEIKEIPKGAYVGYDGAMRVSRPTRMAVAPIGYWHGYDRRFSNIGTVLVRGKRAPVLGIISMDMTMIDVTGIRNVKIGDEVVMIGRQGREKIMADDMAQGIGTTAYELLTRLNPLIRRSAI